MSFAALEISGGVLSKLVSLIFVNNKENGGIRREFELTYKYYFNYGAVVVKRACMTMFVFFK